MMYFVSFTYGIYEDFTSVDMFISTDINEARAAMDKIYRQVSVMMTQLNIDPTTNYAGFGVPEAIYNVANDARWADGTLIVHLFSMPIGKIVKDRKEIDHKNIDVMLNLNGGSYPHWVDDSADLDMPALEEYEKLAFPYETEYYGYKNT